MTAPVLNENLGDRDSMTFILPAVCARCWRVTATERVLVRRQSASIGLNVLVAKHAVRLLSAQALNNATPWKHARIARAYTLKRSR